MRDELQKRLFAAGRVAVFRGNRTTGSSSIVSAVDHCATYAVFSLLPFKV